MYRRVYRKGILLWVLAGGIVLSGIATWAATKAVDLDKNGIAESSCALNILSTYPAKVENVVTNKAVGYAFTFSWVSAGPGGFIGSVVAPATRAMSGS